MQINCPNCSTKFSVPDKALGDKGRTLKCAKCGHKWFQAVISEDDYDRPPAFTPSFAMSDMDEPAEPTPSFRVSDPDLGQEFDATPSFSPSSFSTSSAPSRADDDNFDLSDPPIPEFGPGFARTPEPEGGPADIDLSDESEPSPIPNVFAQPAAPERKGRGAMVFLWLTMFVLVLAALGAAAWHFQDALVDAVPELGDVLTQAGLRREKPGAGLELRNAGTPERFVHNDTEVLIVRGIIANVTDRARPVPPMKLVLLDKNKQAVQEKLSQPPVTTLDPQGTAGFRIILERPNPNAVEVNVMFVDAAEAAKGGN